MRRANTFGPQRVTVRGHAEAVVISARDYDRLVPPANRQPLIDFLAGLSLDGVDLTRDDDRGRDVEL